MAKPQLWQGFRGPAAGDGEQLTPPRRAAIGLVIP